MVKMNILNIEGFLQAVNDCLGPVYLLEDDGRADICRCEGWQQTLRRRHLANGGRLPLRLELPAPQDHMRLVCYYTGDC